MKIAIDMTAFHQSYSAIVTTFIILENTDIGMSTSEIISIL